jgi:hypothetical protein
MCVCENNCPQESEALVLVWWAVESIQQLQLCSEIPTPTAISHTREVLQSFQVKYPSPWELVLVHDACLTSLKHLPLIQNLNPPWDNALKMHTGKSQAFWSTKEIHE